jgi:dolichol-phosphate mannosyltransferase
MSLTTSPSTIDRLESGEAPRINLPRLTVIVPCHNESESLVKLGCRLELLQEALAERYSVELLLVDDGSTDDTWTVLRRVFGGRAGVSLVRHEKNRGIAAAIHTGLLQTTSEIAASLDADCTYDPLQLIELLARLKDDVDLVVASPYHPRGKVLGVPAWRLGLSRLASRLYQTVMRNKLHTYTSCVRVYRRSSTANLPLLHGGFVGIVELVWQLDRRGGKVVECPAVLTVRTTGQSKMRVARTAAAHLRLLARAAGQRCFGPPAPGIRQLKNSVHS